jgi:regulatory protein
LERPGATDVRAAALRLLARREYARAELELRLSRRGAEPAEIARVLDALERDGYLSDARYARMVVMHKAGRYGKRAIAHALRGHGVDPDAARQALDALQGADELSEARALVARRFTEPPRDERERARRIRFLMARGYGVAVAREAVSGTRSSTSDVD